MRTRFYWLAVLARLLLSMAGCARGEETAANVVTAGPPPVGVELGHVAPALTLQDLAGEDVSLEAYRGRPVLINFWAVWCGFCRIELPEMQAVYDAYRDRGFVILAVDVAEPREEVAPFVDELELTFPVLLDKETEVARSYRVRGLPTSYFLDQDGVIIGKQLGPIDEAWIEGYLAEAGIE